MKDRRSLRFRLKDLWDSVECSHEQVLNLEAELADAEAVFKKRIEKFEAFLPQVMSSIKGSRKSGSPTSDDWACGKCKRVGAHVEGCEDFKS